MKISFTLLLLCALQHMVTSARTFDNISNDFKKYVESIDTMFSKETYIMAYEEDGQDLIQDYRGAIFMMLTTTWQKLQQLQDFLNDSAEQIVIETGMSSHEELIDHCQTYREDAFSKLMATVETSALLCAQMEEKYLQELQTILEEIKYKYSPLHNELQAVVPSCITGSQTNAQLVNCMVRNLYVKLAPEVGHAMLNMRDDIAGMNVTVTDKLVIIQSCYDNVAVISGSTVETIIISFRECCAAASENIPRF